MAEQSALYFWCCQVSFTLFPSQSHVHNGLTFTSSTYINFLVQIAFIPEFADSLSVLTIMFVHQAIKPPLIYDLALVFQTRLRRFCDKFYGAENILESGKMVDSGI